MNLPPQLEAWIPASRVCDLGPGTPNVAAFAGLKALNVETALAPHPVRDRDMAACCLAGLWLLHDYLDESHRLSQDIHSAEGSFWHAIMHRREGDFSNSKYWLRRVGSHTLFAELSKQAPAVGFDYSTPFDFVNACERVLGSGSAEEEIAKRVQALEWRLLFDWCIERATA